MLTGEYRYSEPNRKERAVRQPDYQFCGEKVANGFSYDNQCCNYACYHADDDQHCGSCANDCTTNGGNACVTQPGQCVLNDLGVRCERQIDESICAGTVSPPGQEIHCVSLGNNPPLAVCEPYTPSNNFVEWISLASARTARWVRSVRRMRSAAAALKAIRR